jgi:ribosomal protein S18 acetylase RimI-like enzyme
MSADKTPLRLGELADADRAGWQPLAEGYKLFYKTEVDAAGYDEAWRRLRLGGDLLGRGAWQADDTGTGERLVGIAHAVWQTSVWAPRVCYLQDLFVDPAARGQGVAAALIQHLAQQARAAGAQRFYWLTHDTNARARALYDRVAHYQGFIRYDHRDTTPL